VGWEVRRSNPRGEGSRLRFLETFLAGLHVVEIEPHNDERGFFARSFCTKEFKDRGLESSVAQCNISFNARAGTVRGLHFQAEPYGEAKLVRCTRGAIYDVAVDIRPRSKTFLKWYAIELTSENRRMMFIPQGFAHGFQTLVDESEVSYVMFELYHPEAARGFRWDDPKLGITWPLVSQIVSDKDRMYPLIHTEQS
jgi:dTDP-4-dehydrorhamnose 3,5-epimerase